MIDWLHLLSCRHSLARWERARDESPSTRTPLGCRLHFGICRHCRRYRKQLEMVQRALRRLEVQSETDRQHTLPDRFKSELQRRLREELPSDA